MGVDKYKHLFYNLLYQLNTIRACPSHANGVTAPLTGQAPIKNINGLTANSKFT